MNANASAMQAITPSCPSESCRYNLDTPPLGRWSGNADFPVPPPVGTRVRVPFNGLGNGVVQGYFIEHGFVGVHLLPEARPDWHARQNPDKNYYLVFGSEISIA